MDATFTNTKQGTTIVVTNTFESRYGAIAAATEHCEPGTYHIVMNGIGFLQFDNGQYINRKALQRAITDGHATIQATNA